MGYTYTKNVFIVYQKFDLLSLATLGGEVRERTEGVGVEGEGPLLILTSGLCTEYKECFSLYDKQQRGKIKAPDLMVVMRCLGASPTPGEVQRHLQTHGIGEWAGPGQGQKCSGLVGEPTARQLWPVEGPNRWVQMAKE